MPPELEHGEQQHTATHASCLSWQQTGPGTRAISSPHNLAVATLVERGQMNVLGNKDYIFKRFLGAPEHVYYTGVQDEAARACALVHLPYGGSGDSKEGDGCREERVSPRGLSGHRACPWT